jgi:hypothetical protein
VIVQEFNQELVIFSQAEVEEFHFSKYGFAVVVSIQVALVSVSV